VLGNGQQQLRQPLITQHVEDESGQNQRGSHRCHVQNAAQPLPALAFWIEEDLFIGHERSGSSFYIRKPGVRKPGKRSTLYSTNRMEAAPESQLPVPRPASVRLYAALSVALALAAGLGLRLWMLKQFFNVEGDPLVYGGLAKNLLLSGRYALTAPGGEIYCTLIRLPGYPLFLALCFRLFGMENYASAAWVQIPLDLAGCLLLADFAGRIAPVLTGQTIPAPLGAWKVSPSESMLCQKLEHFRKLCRPVLHWYPTHFPNKRGNGRGTGVYSKSKNALAFYFGAASRSGSEFHSGSVPSSKFAPGSGAEARSCSGFCSGAAHGTLWLAALCPFTAIYAAQPLTESLTLFVLALALWSAARFREQPAWGYALWFTFAVTYAALLRPDGALIGVALAPALVIGWRRGREFACPILATARKGGIPRRRPAVAHGPGLHAAGAGSLCRLELAQLAGLPRL
jgi:hypothetical protein